MLSFVPAPEFTEKVSPNSMCIRPQTCWGTVCQCFWAQRWSTTHQPWITTQLGTTMTQVHSSLVHGQPSLNLTSPHLKWPNIILPRPSPLVFELIWEQDKWAGRGEGKHRPLHGDSGRTLRFTLQSPSQFSSQRNINCEYRGLPAMSTHNYKRHSSRAIW